VGAPSYNFVTVSSQSSFDEKLVITRGIELVGSNAPWRDGKNLPLMTTNDFVAILLLQLNLTVTLGWSSCLG
jgi:hypothetical protein